MKYVTVLYTDSDPMVSSDVARVGGPFSTEKQATDFGARAPEEFDVFVLASPPDESDGSVHSEDVLGPIQDAWRIIEEALTELGIGGPVSRGKEMMFRSRAEEVSKAIVARFARNDPPILLEYHREHIQHAIEYDNRKEQQ